MELAVQAVLANADKHADRILSNPKLNNFRLDLKRSRCSRALPDAVATVLINASRLLRHSSGSGSAQAPGSISRRPKPIPTAAALRGAQRRPRERWQVHELEMVLAAVLEERERRLHAAGAPTAAPRSSAAQQLLAHLGWDPSNVRLRRRLHAKIAEMRAMLDNGEEITFNSRRGDRDRGVHWLDWCRKAFLELPGNEGTYEDLCASLEKDPEIAPLLDQRIDTGRRHRRSGARWRRNVLRALPKILGLTKTGEKQGRLSVYRYDPVAGELLAAAAKRRKQARGKGGGGKGEASMPHLGKEQ